MGDRCLPSPDVGGPRPQGGKWRAALLAAFLCIAAPPRASAAGELSQDAIKAGFLYNFAQYATWPGADGHDRPVTLCVERGKLDEKVFAGWNAGKMQGRRLRVVTLARPETRPESGAALAGCDLLFIGRLDSIDGMVSLVELARGRHILLMSDADGFAASGGHIELYLDGSQFRFRINLDELKRTGIELSSKVLRLAEIIEGASGRGSP